MQLHVLLCFRGQHQQAVGAAHGHQPAGHLVTCREEGCGQSRYPSEMTDRMLTEEAVRTTFKRLVYDTSDVNQLTDVDHRASVMDGPATARHWTPCGSLGYLGTRTMNLGENVDSVSKKAGWR